MRILCTSKVTVFALAVDTSAQKKCLLVPTLLSNTYSGVCLHDDAPIPYVLKIEAGGQSHVSSRVIGCQLQIVIIGDIASTAPSPLTTPLSVVQKEVIIFTPKFGNVREGSITVTSSKCSMPWSCQSIKVEDGFRWWQLDCDGVLRKSGDKMRLYLGGTKSYGISIVTNPSTDIYTTEADPVISISLIGNDGRSTKSLTLLAGSIAPGVLTQLVLRAADIGTIKSIKLLNHIENHPWTFKLMTIQTENGQLAKFQGGQWIGKPFVTEIEIQNLDNEGGSLDETKSLSIDCHTRLIDLMTGTNTKSQRLKVSCPQNCNSDKLSFVAGLGLHPASSSICSSAYVDGSLSASGGDLAIFVQSGNRPDTFPVLLNVSDIKIYPYQVQAVSSEAVFYTLSTDSIDDIVSAVRIVDPFGKLSHSGRLELQRNNIWGTVCTEGHSSKFNREAAKMACREMGYLWGDIIDTPCAIALGFNMCGPSSLPVHAGGITCQGNEDTFGDCLYQPPAAKCSLHGDDVIIRCTNHPQDAKPSQGTLRMVDSTGSPAVSGLGRLELFVGDTWGSICNDAWTREDAAVACADMGFDSIKDLSSIYKEKAVDDDVCENIMGTNYCGDTLQKIAASHIACEGSETTIKECPMDVSEDIYCVHYEDVVIGCDGAGDPSGVGLYAKDQVPFMETKITRPLTSLTCTDKVNLLTQKFKTTLPGNIYLVKCAAKCRRQSGSVVGTGIYSASSSLCKAAIHAGYNSDDGASFVIIVTHGQTEYFGSPQNGIQSDPGDKSELSFLVAPMVADISSKVRFIGDDESLSNIIRFGYFGESRLASTFEEDREKSRRKASISNVLSFLQLSSSDEVDVVVETPKPLVAFCNSEMNKVHFQGGLHDSVTLNFLPNGDRLASLTSFSLLVRFKMDASSNGKWRSVVSYSECDGFSLSIDPDEKLVFEQLCSPNVIYTRLSPQPGIWMTLIVGYDKSKSTITFYDNDKLVLNEKADFPIRWQGYMRAGKSSGLEYEPFIGEISQIFIYEKVLEEKEAIQAAVKSIDSICAVQLPPSQPPVYSSDKYRLCLTACEASPETAVKLASSFKPNATITELSCDDSLDTRPDLSGIVGTKFQVSCPENCDKRPRIPPSREVFPGNYSICTSVTLPDPHKQKIEITLMPGQTSYLPEPVLPYNIRSYRAQLLTSSREITCNTTTQFLTLRRPLGSLELLYCPDRCEVTNEDNSLCQHAYTQGFVSRRLGGEFLTQIALVPGDSLQRRVLFIPTTHGALCHALDSTSHIDLVSSPAGSLVSSNAFVDEENIALIPGLCEQEHWTFIKNFRCDSIHFRFDTILKNNAAIIMRFGSTVQISVMNGENGVECKSFKSGQNDVSNSNWHDIELERSISDQASTQFVSVRIEGQFGAHKENLLTVTTADQELCHVPLVSDDGYRTLERLGLSACQSDRDSFMPGVVFLRNLRISP